MFVRRKPNKSGKVSVQVVLKSKLRKQQVIKTIGCSSDADEIERLVAEGRLYIEHLCGRLYDKIGYNAIPSEMFRHMVICRLFNPESKLKTVDYLERFFHHTCRKGSGR